MSRVDRKSEAQANAEALARRGASYAEANRQSYVLKMQRTDPPEDLRTLVNQLRRAYADEVPTRIHVHQTDAGGDPAWSPEFTRYITGSDHATDRKDDGTTEVYVTPFRAAMAGMVGPRGELVSDVVCGGFGPAEAAKSLGVPEWCAKMVAAETLRTFWRRLSDIRIDLRSEQVA